MKINHSAAKRSNSLTISTSRLSAPDVAGIAGGGRASAPSIFIVDLEATCWSDRLNYTIAEMELIEIGCVLVTPQGDILDEFATFVRPLDEPALSAYCTRLTGIRQRDVDEAPYYPDAMHEMDKWVGERRGIWGSWGNFDHQLFAAMERRYQTNSRFLSMEHVNLKRPWKQTNRTRRTALRSALEYHRIEFVGKPHRGIDDARNIARLLPYIDNQKLLASIGAMGVITNDRKNTDKGESKS